MWLYLVLTYAICHCLSSNELDYQCEYSNDYWKTQGRLGEIKMRLFENPTRISAVLKSETDVKMKYSKEFCIKCIVSESNYTIGSCLFGDPQTGIDIILHTKSNAKALSLTVMPQNKVEKMIDVIVRTPTIVSKPELRKYTQSQSESQAPNLIQSIMLFMRRYWYIILPISLAYIVAGVIKAANDEQESN